jgi:hypothetical protein
VKKGLIVTAVVLLSIILSTAALAGNTNKLLTLVKNGESDYQIVIPANAWPNDRLAAEELRNFIKQMSGAFLTIATDDSVPAAHEIILGAQNRHLGYTNVKIDAQKIGKEGFTIRTAGQNLVIAGGPWKGTLFGVYTFLESLGCRWYSPTVSIIPNKSTIEIGAINDTQRPALEGYREIFSDRTAYAVGREAFGPRLKLGQPVPDSAKADPDDGYFAPTGFAHTIQNLYIRPEDYAKDHPEYFALINGQRDAQEPCLSNPEVFKIVSNSLRKLMVQYPHTKLFSVSQMDNAGYCQCDKCKAIDDREGTPAGSVITFVNKLAREFPNIQISTLAYWYTYKPPKTLQLEPNVHIMYCTNSYTAVPLEKDPIEDNKWVKENFLGWAKLTQNFFIWEYTQPAGVLEPFPVLQNIGPNLRYYVDHGAKGAFIEAAASPGAEFMDLRNYMYAKLMWNPQADDSAIMDDFLNGFYGAGGPFIRKYIDTTHDYCVANNVRISNRDWAGTHAGDFLKPEMLAKYDEYFDAAEKAVANQPDVLLRVQNARLPLMHAELLLGYGDVDKRIAQAQQFRDICTKTGVTHNWDFWRDPIEGHVNWLMGELEKEKATKK